MLTIGLKKGSIHEIRKYCFENRPLKVTKGNKNECKRGAEIDKKLLKIKLSKTSATVNFSKYIYQLSHNKKLQIYTYHHISIMRVYKLYAGTHSALFCVEKKGLKCEILAKESKDLVTHSVSQQLTLRLDAVAESRWLSRKRQLKPHSFSSFFSLIIYMTIYTLHS